MCGRFALELPWTDVAKLLGAEPLDDGAAWSASYNICPTDRAPVARVASDGRVVLEPMRWGLVPHWAKDLRVGARMINARSETVATKAAFRSSFKSRRCLIPASGFYEWTVDADKKKVPNWIHHPDGEALVFAGLWSSWRDPKLESPPSVRSFSIITTEASEAVASLHDRMPVVLDAAGRSAWLSDETLDDELASLMVPWAGSIAHFPVAPLVNNVRAEGPELIAPAPSRAAELEQLGLVL